MPVLLYHQIFCIIESFAQHAEDLDAQMSVKLTERSSVPSPPPRYTSQSPAACHHQEPPQVFLHGQWCLWCLRVPPTHWPVGSSATKARATASGGPWSPAPEPSPELLADQLHSLIPRQAGHLQVQEFSGRACAWGTLLVQLGPCYVQGRLWPLSKFGDTASVLGGSWSELLVLLRSGQKKHAWDSVVWLRSGQEAALPDPS